jgi:hypothetical protein
MLQITKLQLWARASHALSRQPPARNPEPANPQLRARLARQEMLKQQRDRRKNLQKYIPFVARSLAGMLESISEDGVAESVSQDASIIKTMEAYASKDITEDILQVWFSTLVIKLGHRAVRGPDNDCSCFFRPSTDHALNHKP